MGHLIPFNLCFVCDWVDGCNRNITVNNGTNLFNALLVLRSLVCINQHACLNMITYPRIKKRSTKGAKTKIVSLFDRNFIFFA